MDVQVKTFKRDYGYIEWKDIQKYIGTLEDGFDYYYREIKSTRWSPQRS